MYSGSNRTCNKHCVTLYFLHLKSIKNAIKISFFRNTIINLREGIWRHCLCCQKWFTVCLVPFQINVMRLKAGTHDDENNTYTI